MVIAGFQPSSSFKIERQTVPDGYTLGWNSGGTNLPTKGQQYEKGHMKGGRSNISEVSWGTLQ